MNSAKEALEAAEKTVKFGMDCNDSVDLSRWGNTNALTTKCNPSLMRFRIDPIVPTPITE